LVDVYWNKIEYEINRFFNYTRYTPMMLLIQSTVCETPIWTAGALTAPQNATPQLTIPMIASCGGEFDKYLGS
jgi:hypothetical protein